VDSEVARDLAEPVPMLVIGDDECPRLLDGEKAGERCVERLALGPDDLDRLGDVRRDPPHEVLPTEVEPWRACLGRCSSDVVDERPVERPRAG
jgi:hypothetical protein